ncbi:MAG: sigma-70 family RNA polymerase sigma factor [Planctomycetes bacterium]|nr:sigma-70 family RNA polymerase sigma factor [Planctomycetota bacterium]
MATLTNRQKNTDNIDNIRLVELVLAAQTGDRAAFGELFERFERHVFAIALRRLGDYAEAEELAQDVFVQAMQKLEQLRQPECFGGWLRSITHRMAINRVVRRGPDVPTEPGTLAATCVDDATPLASALQNERHGQLHDGLGRLRDLDRETLVAFYMKGQSLLEMSDDFDAPIGTIKRRLHVARKRLAKQVEEVAI